MPYDVSFNVNLHKLGDDLQGGRGEQGPGLAGGREEHGPGWVGGRGAQGQGWEGDRWDQGWTRDHQDEDIGVAPPGRRTTPHSVATGGTNQTSVSDGEYILCLSFRGDFVTHKKSGMDH